MRCDISSGEGGGRQGALDRLLPQLLDLRVCSGGGASLPLQAWDSSSGHP